MTGLTPAQAAKAAVKLATWGDVPGQLGLDDFAEPDDGWCLPIDSHIPARWHPAVRLAREEWQRLWPGMELDYTADLIVLALIRAGWMRRRKSPGQTL